MAHEHVVMAKGVYEAFRVRDLDGVFRHLTPDFTASQSPELPWGGFYRGHDQFRIFMGKLFANAVGVLEFHHFLDAVDVVAVIGRTHGTLLGSSERFDQPFVHLWHVRDGQFSGVEFYVDVPKMIKAGIAK